MSALGLLILLGIAFLGGVFLGVYITLPKKKGWVAQKVVGFVERNTSREQK